MNRLFIISLLLISSSLMADEVVLSDGSIIKGKIVQIHQDKLVLKSALIGEIKVATSNITSYKTDEQVTYKTDEGKVSKGIYDSKENEKINSLWSGDMDPDLFVNKWKRLIYFNMVKRNGNKDEENIDGGFELKYLREFDTLTLYAGFENDTRNDSKTADEYRWGIDYEKRFGENLHHSWYIRADWEKDKLKELDLRSTYATGYGYYFIKETGTLLRGRAGLLYRTEEFIDGESNDSIGIDFGLSFEKTIFDDIAWYTKVTYAPAFEDFGDFRLDHESGVTIPFATDITMSLKAGVNHEYDSSAAEGTENLDTKYFMRLQIEF